MSYNQSNNNGYNTSNYSQSGGYGQSGYGQTSNNTNSYNTSNNNTKKKRVSKVPSTKLERVIGFSHLGLKIIFGTISDKTIETLKNEITEQRNLTKEIAQASSKSQISQTFAKN